MSYVDSTTALDAGMPWCTLSAFEPLYERLVNVAFADRRGVEMLNRNGNRGALQGMSIALVHQVAYRTRPEKARP